MPTGRDNADLFVQTVLKDDVNIVIKYGDQWKWMCNKEWREYVLIQLTGEGFSKMYFAAPDELDGWTFTAYRKGSKLPIADRSLDDEAI